MGLKYIENVEVVSELVFENVCAWVVVLRAHSKLCSRLSVRFIYYPLYCRLLVKHRVISPVLWYKA